MEPAPQISCTPSTYRPAKVRLSDYDPTWPLRYEAEETLLREALGSRMLAVEHIGSTSVPGMPSKPTIDILVGLSDYERFHDVVHALESVGYLYTPEAEADDPGRRVFRKGPDQMSRPRTFHLHVTPLDGHYWRRMLAFRDHLRRHPDDAATYVALKRRLALEHSDEPRRYTAAKHEFVKAVERRAGVR